ncbi:NAD(P)H-dependent oxidoreductase [Cellulomonas sp. NS3]|uniref:NAD(P)H-dependent oxidoreductase n=1 Tax=Cellulomonas sp. NS3 TaxID=2973977 RepID=UPI002161B8F9|nr:NAD(P)H-dependent oxidoreductase [Cellulomonas sp. NS3]
MTRSTETPLKVVAVNGSPSVPSKTAALVAEIVERLGRHLPLDATTLHVTDLVPFFTDTYGDPGSPIARSLAEIAAADLVVAASPIYKGSYTGLFKHVFDLLAPTALAGTPVLLVATGGSERHTLALEHQFRPLFGFFQAETLPLAIYAHDSEFTSYQVTGAELDSRIDKALARALPFLSERRRDESLVPSI